MKLTKTWLSYIMWGIFSIVFFADIGIAAIEIFMEKQSAGFLVPVVFVYLCVVAGIALCIGLYKVLEHFVLPRFDFEIPALKGAAEIFSFSLFLFVAVAVRVIAMISAEGNLQGITAFYENAIAQSDSGFDGVYSNGVYIYVGLLKFVLSFLGHKPMAAMALQTLLQTLTIVVIYFMVKKSVGRLAAWICSCLYAFLPGCFFAVRVCTPDALFVLLLACYLLGLVYLCSFNTQNNVRGEGYLFFYFLIGIGAGILAHFDIVGLLAVVFGIVAIFNNRNELPMNHVQKLWVQLLIYVVSFLISFLLLLWFLPCCGFEIGPEAVLGYIKCFLPDANFNLMILSPHKGSWDCIPLFIMAGLWFVGFLRIRKDKVFPFVFMIVVLTIASFFGIGTYEYSGVASYAWIMLAGIGCVSFEAFSKKERVAEFVQKEEREKEIRKLERERMLEIENERKNVGKVKEEKKTRRTVPECVELTPVKIILSEDFPDEEKSSESDEMKQLGIGRRNVPQTYHSNVAVADRNAVGKKETVEPASEAGTVTESMEETIPEMEKVTEAIEEIIPETQKEIEVVKESVTESEKEIGVLEESVSESNIYNAAQTVSVDGINVAKVILSSESETSDVKEQNNVSQPAVSRRYLKMPSSGASLSEEPGNTRADIAKVEVPKNVDVAERPKVVVVSQDTPKPIHQEESLSDIKTVSERKPKMIRNPLAGPKPHVPRELNYDYEPVDAEMKFDIDDISGRDYYDL